MSKTRKVSYADMMETWAKVLIVLYFYLAIVLGVTDFVSDNIDSLIICLIGMAFILCVAWLPGLLVAAFLDGIYPRLTTVNSVYEKPRCILVGRIRVIRETLRGGFDCWGTEAAFIAVSILTGTTIGLSIIGVFLQDGHILMSAVSVGMVLSWGGAITIVPILARDAIRARRLKKSPGGGIT